MLTTWIVSTTLLIVSAGSGPDIVVADFENDTYGDWTVSGDAFGQSPAPGSLDSQMKVTGFEGKGLVNSYHGGDASTGTLISPPFSVERPFINFLIGGGNHPESTCMNLIVDKKVVRTATGPNDKPGGSENLDWQSWDVREFLGKQAVLEIVDRETGGWGHINIDHIVMSDTKMFILSAERTLKIDKRYIHLPVKNGANKRRMKITRNGDIVREFEIELADDNPDFWVFCDVEAFKGEEITIQVDRLRAASNGLSSIIQKDQIPGIENLYKEKHRPQFHFSSRRGWNNDPNGLVYYKGEYHLYYQHNPYGWAWGNMHWGHAVSSDLVHWQELPIALYPHQFGDWCFSGSAFIDWDNTGGFQSGSEPALIAAYTSTGRGECIAYSNDRGRTFTDYAENPVVKHKGRDPKVIWYQPGGHWVMAVFDEWEDSRYIAFYTSGDLKNWEFQSRIEGFFECPEIFLLTVDDDPKNQKWVLYAADGNYAIGSFDGKTFTPESEKLQGNYGNCFYASQTYTDIPQEDGRRIQIGWGRINTPGMPFNQMMTFPVKLTLRKTEEGVRMFAEPVREIESLHTKTHKWDNKKLGADTWQVSEVNTELLHIRGKFDVKEHSILEMNVRGVCITYNSDERKLSCLDKSAPLSPDAGQIQLEILVDRTSVEIFANQGRIYMPIGTILDSENKSLILSSKGNGSSVVSLEVYELKSAW